MPACATPELWPVWCMAGRGSRSSTTTLRPARRRASSRATARPRMPAPTTAKSASATAPAYAARGRAGRLPGMPAYVLARQRVPDPDADALRRYREASGALVERFGGRFLVRGGPIDTLEGDAGADRIVV